MNKKILFLILSAVLIIPAFANANVISTAISTLYATARGAIVGLVIIGWVITGGLYLTAAGAPEKLGTAKKALIATVIGTLVMVLAQGSGQVLNDIGAVFGL